jgi:hypothetical protein
VASLNKELGSNMKGDFPTHFPLIERAVLSREDHLIIIKSSGKLPNEEDYDLRDAGHYLVYDRLGNPIEPNDLDRHVWRVAWLDDPWVWVNIYNANLDEHTVLRCARSDIDDVVVHYPLFD